MLTSMPVHNAMHHAVVCSRPMMVNAWNLACPASAHLSNAKYRYEQEGGCHATVKPCMHLSCLFMFVGVGHMVSGANGLLLQSDHHQGCV